MIRQMISQADTTRVTDIHAGTGCQMRYRLSVPKKTKKFHAILVEVDMVPEQASCTIYGLMEDGQSASVIVNGSQEAVELPFASPQICVSHDDDVTVRIGTIGYRQGGYHDVWH